MYVDRSTALSGNRETANEEVRSGETITTNNVLCVLYGVCIVNTVVNMVVRNVTVDQKGPRGRDGVSSRGLEECRKLDRRGTWMLDEMLTWAYVDSGT